MSTRTRRLARFSLRLAQIGGVVFLLAPLVYRLGVGLGPAFAMLALGVLACVVALVVASGTWLFSRRGPDVVPPARAAVIVALVVLVAPVWSVVNGRGAPPIHHVTTDPADPPRTVKSPALRMTLRPSRLHISCTFGFRVKAVS